MSDASNSTSSDDFGASIAIQLKPSYVVLGEVQNVIAAMRLNTRWSSRRGQKGKESPLLTNLLKLRKKLETEPDVFPTTDVLDILKPFLDVIKSDKTTGPITGVALSSVYKFLQYGFLGLDRQGSIRGIEEIGAAVTHCRFEGTDPETDEVVLTKILNVLRKAVQVEAGALLSDQLVYDMVQTCFKMSIQMHLSVLLRKSAELALMEIVQHVFGVYGSSRKHQTEQAAVTLLTQSSNLQRLSSEINQSESPSVSRAAVVSSLTTTADGSVLSSDDPPHETAFINPAGVRFDADDDLAPKSAVSHSGLRPFGLPVLVKLFRFFCSIINPNYANNTDTMRFLGLALVNCVLEISSSTVEKTPKLLELVRDDLSKFLLQSLGTTDNVSIMTVSLRVAFNLFISLRHKLKFQMELFFNYIFRLFQHVVEDSSDVVKPADDTPETGANPDSTPLPAPSTAPALRGDSSFPYEHLEIALETIVQLCADPNFLVDMYINYDCDLNSNNLFSHLADFLFKTAFPHNGQLVSINLLALDGLLAILFSVENRFQRPASGPSTSTSPGVTAEQLKERKNQKNLLLAAANHFNRKPKDGIKFLLDKKILPSSAQPKDFALFFKNNKWINKTKLGEFFGEPDEFNVNCLREFIGLMTYNGRKFVDVVREFLQSFRIPGEAQKIERIMDLFSKDYFERERGPCKTLDASYLLCFSIVMLNTELYNPNVQPHRKMTMEGYLKNLKGTNGGADFPPELLSENYNSIKDNEIKIPEEQVNERHISNSTWRYLLVAYDQQDSSCTASNVDSGVYDKFLFSLTWRQIHSAVRSVFAASTDSDLSEQMLQALNLSGEICAHFSLHHAFDNLVNILGELTTLLTSPGATPYAEKLRYVQFSRNKRAQLATVALFNLARTCPTQLREGWKTILTVLFNVSPLLKLPILDREDIFNFPKSLLLDQPPKEKQESAPSPILGIVSSFWPFGGGSSASNSSSADAEEDYSSSDDEVGPEPASFENETPRDRLRRLITHDCKLAKLLEQSRDIDMGSLDHLIKNLIATASPKWVKQGGKEGKHPHAPTNREVNLAVFAVDVLVDVVASNAHRQKQIWPHIHDLFEKILLGLPSPNPLTSKCILSLFYLAAKLIPECIASGVDDILATIRIIPKMHEENIVFYSERIGFAIGKLIMRCCEFSKTDSMWQTLMQLAHWTLQFPKFSKDAFDSIIFAVSPFRFQQKASIKHQQQAPEAPTPVISYARNFSFVTAVNFGLILDTIVAFGRLPSCPVEVALESLELLQLLVSNLPALLGLPVSATVPLTVSGSIPQELLTLDSVSEQRALETFVVPLFAALSERTKDSRVLVRHHAMSHLQKGLLAPEMAVCTSASWLQIFDRIIFPLLVELLQPVSHDTPRDVVEETRLRASSLLCKTFLHYMPRIDVSSFHMLWLKVLSFVEMYMKADNSELLSEAVTESLKNILLVMFASGLLAKPTSSIDGAPNPDGSTLWDLSWKTIDTFSPNLRKEFMLKVYPAPEVSLVAPQSSLDSVHLPTDEPSN
eukprot:TRINITY_DN3314_c0_g1_i1.p1 TRINITY_DN3314_c0_g1~~TRINITY_DN3314_c0_g1_i1.p1  ORF type:complete len:1532 (-),score=259.60 TRINITY_DN3314_c0_g1_i1:126-4721(-)